MVGGRENIPPSVEMQKQPAATDTGNRKRNKRAGRVNNLEEKAEQQFWAALNLLTKTQNGCSISLLKLMNGHKCVCVWYLTGISDLRRVKDSVWLYLLVFISTLLNNGHGSKHIPTVKC